MAQVEVVSERERPGGWEFDLQVLDDEGELRRHQLRLSWADYGLWSPSGSAEPAGVAAAVMRFLLSRDDASEIRESMDAAVVRRLHADADAEIPRFI